MRFPLNRIRPHFPDKNNQGGRRPGFDTTLFRKLSYALFAIGMAASTIIYFVASPAPENPFGYDPLYTKKYLHDLEVYGGTLNIISAEFMQWFGGLWHGHNLAYTVAFMTLIVSCLFWAIGSPENHPAENGSGKNGGS